MARSRLSTIVGVAAGCAAVTTAAAVAERHTVSRWVAAPDPYGDEPVTIAGALPRATASKVTSSDGAVLNVVEAGVGPTVVLVHGVTATADHWAPIAVRLAERGTRIVAFDQRGHGRSTAGSGAFTTELLGGDLDAVVRAAAPEGAVIVGHSMGGITVQSWLAGQPETAAAAGGLVLVATLHRRIGNARAKLMRRLAGTPVARVTMRHPVHGRLMARNGLGRQPSITIIDVVRGGWATCPDSTRAGVFRDLHFDFTELLTTIRLPTTVVCGELDKVTPPAESERIAELVPDARLEIVPDAGHAVIWEAADRVADAIAELARNPGGTA